MSRGLWNEDQKKDIQVPKIVLIHMVMVVDWSDSKRRTGESCNCPSSLSIVDK